jgi:hypothetical protein
MMVSELRRSIAERQARGQPTAEERIELHRKFSIPFACVVFAVVGLPLGIQPSRAVRSRGFAVSIVLIFLYYVPLTVGETLAKKQILEPALGLWIPNFAFLALGVWLFSKAARESPFGGLDRAEALWVALRHRAVRWASSRSAAERPDTGSEGAERSGTADDGRGAPAPGADRGLRAPEEPPTRAASGGAVRKTSRGGRRA